MDLALWQQNTDGDPRHFRAERCWVVEEDKAVTGCVALKTPDTPPAWPGQDPKQAWISFLLVEPGREADIGAALLQRALDWLGRAQFERVAYGGDPSHFFPGAPEEDDALGRTLQGAGFELGASAYDLLGDMRDYHASDTADHSLAGAGVTFSACGRRDAEALLAFVDRCFPGRWAYETRQRLEIEPTPADVLILKSGADVVGFCHAYHRGSRRIGPSIYWRQALGEGYGGLGPIGVAPALRGRGLGRALLALAIGHLRDLGAERVVIDWTTLVDFYGRLGFRVWRTYRHWRLEL
jgi:predicted N-acetyltransferase YhbS